MTLICTSGLLPWQCKRKRTSQGGRPCRQGRRRQKTRTAGDTELLTDTKGPELMLASHLFGQWPQLPSHPVLFELGF